MKNRNKNELIKDTYNIYFILLLAITFVLFIVKLIFEQNFIVINHLTEFVVIVSVISILLKAPKDANEEPLSDYYGKSIRRIFMIGVLSYTVQQVIAIKLNVYETKRIQIYYVSAYLSAIVISLFILKWIKKVYLNYRIIEEKKEVYWSKVSANVGLIFFYMLIILVIAFLLDIFIPGPSSTFQVIITFAFSIIPLIIEYVLLSLYERNNYEEMKLEEKNRRPLLSRNVFLYLSVFISLNILMGITEYVSYLNYLNKIEYESISIFLNFIKPVINVIALLFFIFSLVTTYKNYKVLKNSKKNYLNLLLVIGFLIVLSKFIGFILLFVDETTLTTFESIKVVSMFTAMILEYAFHIILLVYLISMSYPNIIYKGTTAMVFTMRLIFSVLFYLFVLNDNNKSSSELIKNQLIYTLASVLLAVVMYLSDLMLVNSYSKTYEVIDENLEIDF